MTPFQRLASTVLAVCRQADHRLSKSAEPGIEFDENHGRRGGAHFGTTVRHRSRAWLLAWGLTLALGGCNPQAPFDDLLPRAEAEQADQVARELLKLMAARDFAAAQALLLRHQSPGDAPVALQAQLREMAVQLPAREPTGMRIVGSHVLTTPAATRYDLTFEYSYGDAWVVASTVQVRQNGQLTLRNVQFQRRPQSLEAEHAFSIDDRGLPHLAVLAATALIAVLVLVALVLCLKTPRLPRKWLWVLFMLGGVMQLQFNWSTGEWSVRLLHLSWPVVTVFKAWPVGPVMFGLGLPLGALLFLLHRRKAGMPPSP